MLTGKVIQFLPKRLRSKVENNMELRTIMGNVNWLTFENILRNVIGVFVFAWIARYLGPEDFGIMNYSVAFVSLFIAFSTLGLDDIVIRSLISIPKKRKDYLGSTLVLKFLGSLLMVVFSVVGILIVENSDTNLTLFVLILSFGYIFRSMDVIDLWFRSQIKSQYSVYARSLSFVLVSAIKVLLIVTQAPLVAFIVMYSLDFVFTSIFLTYYYKKEAKISLFRWKVNRTIMREILRDCWPLFLGGITLTVQSQFDQVLLKNMVGAEEIGIYSAGLKIITSFAFISVVLKNSFLPSIIAAKKESERLYKKKLEQFSQLMMIMFLMVTIPIVVFKDLIINILYGQEYIAAAGLLPLFCIRLFFIYFGAARYNFLLNENYMKYSFISTLIGAIINIILNLYLIPRYQAIGAITAFSISFFITNFVIDFIYPKTRSNVITNVKSIFNFYKLFFPKDEHVQ